MTQPAMVFGPSYEHLRKMLKIEKLKNEKQMTKSRIMDSKMKNVF